MSLMAADTIEELHAMAEKLGLQRKVIPAGRSPFYEIPDDLTAKAIQLGAVLRERAWILDLLSRQR